MEEITQNVAEVTEAEATEQVDTQEEQTVTVAEMQRRISQANKKHSQEIESLQAEWQSKLDDAVAKAGMTDKERKTYEAEEQARKYQSIENENAELKRQIEQRDLRDNAIKTLTEKGLPVDDAVLAFVVKDTAEDTLDAIENMAGILSKQKQAAAVTQAPMTSGGMGDTAKERVNVADFARKNRIIK